MVRRAKLRVCAAPKGKCAATRAGRSRASGAYRATKGLLKAILLRFGDGDLRSSLADFNLIRCPSPFPHPLMNRSQGWYGPYGAFYACLAATSAHPSHPAPSTGRSRLVRPHHTLPPSDHTRVTRRHVTDCCENGTLAPYSQPHSLAIGASAAILKAASSEAIDRSIQTNRGGEASAARLASSRRRRSRGAVVHHSRSLRVGSTTRRVGAHVGAQLLISPRFSPAPHHLRLLATELSCNGRKRQEWRKREKAASSCPTAE